MKRYLIPLLVLVLLLASVGTLFTNQPVKASDSCAPEKIDPELESLFHGKKNVPFWIEFEQADLSPCALVELDDKSDCFLSTLRDHAATTQANARALLNAEQVSYTAYYITDIIEVPAGNRDLACGLTELDDVQYLRSERIYTLQDWCETDKFSDTLLMLLQGDTTDILLQGIGLWFERADISICQTIEDPYERRICIYDIENAQAEKTQKDVRAFLDSEGILQYYIWESSNTIYIATDTLENDLVCILSVFPEVLHIWADGGYYVPCKPPECKKPPGRPTPLPSW